MHDPDQLLHLGRWIGQSLAFGLIASKCSAAQAQCLKTVREGRLYSRLGLSWEEFCGRHAGLSRPYADQLIRNLDEFGAAYFRLSEFLHISEHSYQQIAASVSEEAVEVDGESIPLVPENAPRIRAAVARLRARLKTQAAGRTPSPSIISLQTRLDACFEEIAELAARAHTPLECNAVLGLVLYSINKLKRRAAALEGRFGPSA